MADQPIEFWFGLGIGALLIGVCYFSALRLLRKRRLIDDLPTSKTKGVFIGLVEVKGTATSATPLISRLAARPCVWFKWCAEEHWSRTVTETVRDAKGRTSTRTRHESGWKTVASEELLMPFDLADDTGALQVNPAGADLEGTCVFCHECRPSDPLYYQHGPASAVMHSDHRRRFTENAIPIGADLYVLGQAREREDIVAAEIAQSDSAPFFLISMKGEESLRSRCAWQGWLLFLLGAAMAGGGGWYLGQIPGSWPGLPFIIVPLYFLIGVIGWTWVVYNSLRGLCNRVKQGKMQIDIQLKRRHDLIPRLTAVVQGLLEHERELQTRLAELRGTGESDAGATLMAVAERYPAITAQPAFVTLQKELTDTEDRLALARNYHLDITTFYNTRLAIVPDGVLAKWAGLREQPLTTSS